MAALFKRFDNITVGTSRTLVYTVPAATTAILFSGEFVNIDSVTKANHSASLEILLSSGTTYVPAGKMDVPVAYGGPLAIEKRVLQAGESVYATASDANSLAVSISVVEMS